jgi:hypothetical protein
LLQQLIAIVVPWTSMIASSEENHHMTTRHKAAAAFVVAAVALGIGGGIVATHAMGNATPPSPAVQGPVADLPEPGDVPDGPGE